MSFWMNNVVSQAPGTNANVPSNSSVGPSLGKPDSMLDNFENEIKLWSIQLQPFLDKQSVVLTGVKDNKIKKFELLEVIEYLKNVDFYEAACAVNFLPNSAFIKVKFESASVATAFIDLTEFINKCQVKFILPMENLNIIPIFISTLPAEDIIPLVGPRLGAWGDILKVHSNSLPRQNGKKCLVGQSRVDFRLKDGVKLEDLPYFVKIYSFKVHLFIKARPRICYRCGDFSHIVANCKWRFCAVCKKSCLIGHSCSLSYAQVASNAQVSDLSIAIQQLQDSALQCEMQSDPPGPDPQITQAGIAGVGSETRSECRTTLYVDDQGLKRQRDGSSASGSSDGQGPGDDKDSPAYIGLPDVKTPVSIIKKKKTRKKDALRKVNAINGSCTASESLSGRLQDSQLLEDKISSPSSVTLYDEIPVDKENAVNVNIVEVDSLADFASQSSKFVKPEKNYECAVKSLSGHGPGQV